MFTAQQIAQFRKAIKDTTDLFFGLTCEYRLYGESTDLFEENNALRSVTVYSLPCLQVFIKSEDGEIEITKIGRYDMSEGYVLLNFQDCETAGLIDAQTKLFRGNPNIDEIDISGQRFKIIAINLLGQWVDKNSLVRIGFRKEIKP